MFVPQSLQLNKFVDVKIPDNKSYFARVGKQTLPDAQYTGDESAFMPSDKVSQIVQAELEIQEALNRGE